MVNKNAPWQHPIHHEAPLNTIIESGWKNMTQTNHCYYLM